MTFSGSEFFSDGTTSESDATWPSIQVMSRALEQFGGPTEVAPFSYVQGVGGRAVQVTAVGSGSLTVRVQALNSLDRWSVLWKMGV